MELSVAKDKWISQRTSFYLLREKNDKEKSQRKMPGRVGLFHTRMPTCALLIYNRLINRLHSLLTLGMVLPCSDHSMTKSFLDENLLYILSYFLPLFFKLISVLCITCSYLYAIGFSFQSTITYSKSSP